MWLNAASCRPGLTVVFFSPCFSLYKVPPFGPNQRTRSMFISAVACSMPLVRALHMESCDSCFCQVAQVSFDRMVAACSFQLLPAACHWSEHCTWRAVLVLPKLLKLVLPAWLPISTSRADYAARASTLATCGLRVAKEFKRLLAQTQPKPKSKQSRVCRGNGVAAA